MQIMNTQIKSLSLAMCLLLASTTYAQLTISTGAVFNIQSGAFVTVQGDVTSNADITGTGNLILKGSANQNISMNGNIVPNLEMDNATGATLTSNIKIGTAIIFTNGKILVGNNTATLSQATTASGMGVSKFFETNGTGYVRRELAADISNSIMPVGAGTDYLPVTLTNTGSTYASASIGVQAKGTANTNRHPRTESFLLANWPINKVGITSGTTNATGTYIDPTRVIGTEADLRGIFWNGTNWSLAGGNQNTTTNTVSADIATNSGELFGMNRFVLLDAKVFLQGAFNAGTGLMNDALRTTSAYIPGNAPTGNLLPSSDPYSTNADYSANVNFTRVANTPTETVTATAFNDQPLAADNIVDWVFLELRNTATTSNAILQTRSALLQRDGDIVDIDGVSPIYFKNIDASNYTIAIRHRNHIAMITNPSVFNQNLSLIKNLTQLNFTNQIAPTNFLGTSNTNYFNNGTFNMLYAGDANGNKITRYSGGSNDRAVILTDLSNVESSTLTGYQKSDLNLNRVVRYSGGSNDRAIILSNVLSSVEGATKSQAIIP